MAKREENKFEPTSGKGAVARATHLLRYQEINRTSQEYELDRLETLLGWHQSNPVTDYERHRNMAIFEEQGNRNPLIDFPEWEPKIEFHLGLGWRKRIALPAQGCSAGRNQNVRDLCVPGPRSCAPEALDSLGAEEHAHTLCSDYVWTRCQTRALEYRAHSEREFSLSPRQNVNKMMQQVQQMQQQMQQAQEELANETVTASAGGGAVKATMTGGMELVSIEIDPEVVDPERRRCCRTGTRGPQRGDDELPGACQQEARWDHRRPRGSRPEHTGSVGVLWRPTQGR